MPKGRKTGFYRNKEGKGKSVKLSKIGVENLKLADHRTCYTCFAVEVDFDMATHRLSDCMPSFKDLEVGKTWHKKSATPVEKRK
jgi:hypothetical protein